jgi:hypothetical protein
MRIVRTPKEISELNRYLVSVDNEESSWPLSDGRITAFPERGYEEGIAAALDWLTDPEAAHPTK